MSNLEINFFIFIFLLMIMILIMANFKKVQTFILYLWYNWEYIEMMTNWNLFMYDLFMLMLCMLMYFKPLKSFLLYYWYNFNKLFLTIIFLIIFGPFTLLFMIYPLNMYKVSFFFSMSITFVMSFIFFNLMLKMMKLLVLCMWRNW